MKRQEALSKMVFPSMPRTREWRCGTIQIWTTRACDRSCPGCTQGSQLRKNSGMFITPENFETACISLKDYFGVIGMFGGNPAVHPQFEELCKIMATHIPMVQRGIWCNNPMGKAHIMRRYFNPNYSNLNVHQNKQAFAEFITDWPESHPFGLEDSIHSPIHGSMIDLNIPEEERWKNISNCDINQRWSALVGQFRGECRAWFCEVAASQAFIWQDHEEYPDTGIPVTREDNPPWWKLPKEDFYKQVDYHCHRCLAPSRGEGWFSNAPVEHNEITTKEYLPVFQIKGKRQLEVVNNYLQLKPRSDDRKITKYNSAIYIKNE